MHLFLDQLVYTSFAGMGFRTLASPQIPAEVQQAFQNLTCNHWDTYNPPKLGYRAVYLHQVTPQQSLFGWLYNDGMDDIGRSNVPYFICYYLVKPLCALQLENIFNCLQKGPVALIDRHSLPATLETIVVPDSLIYQGARLGVAIPSNVRKRSQIALKQGELLDLFVPVTEQEMVIDIEGIQTGAAELENAAANETGIIKSYRNERLQMYEQALVKAIEFPYHINDKTRNFLKRLQQLLRLADEDIEPIEARILGQTKVVQPLKQQAVEINSNETVTAVNEAVAMNGNLGRGVPSSVMPQIISTPASFNQGLDKSDRYNSVLAYRNSQLLLKVGIAATVLALIGSIYGLIQVSISAPSNPEFNRPPTSRVSIKPY